MVTFYPRPFAVIHIRRAGRGSSEPIDTGGRISSVPVTAPTNGATRQRWTWCLTVAALAVLSGCGSTHKQANPASASSTTPSSSARSLAPGVTSSTTRQTTDPAPTASTSPAGPPLCSSSQLSARLSSGNGSPGTIYYQLELRNATASECIVQGYPGVSFVAGTDGHQVGAPATRGTGATPRVVLGRGQIAEATLGIHDASAFTQPPCDQTTVLGLRVYPPGQTAALFVPHQDAGCSNPAVSVLVISPLTAA
jgi:hypothetical protein